MQCLLGGSAELRKVTGQRVVMGIVFRFTIGGFNGTNPQMKSCVDELPTSTSLHQITLIDA
jgi:hypothetical protein